MREPKLDADAWMDQMRDSMAKKAASDIGVLTVIFVGLCLALSATLLIFQLIDRPL